ncbi:hypothetical protein, partial [Streptomyces hygroscopicus]|uniref:hypothetical protein n=1 Tax=Streptomyces hygroscopicus TaxID=1912 RepID=UPI0007673871
PDGLGAHDGRGAAVGLRVPAAPGRLRAPGWLHRVPAGCGAPATARADRPRHPQRLSGRAVRTGGLRQPGYGQAGHAQTGYAQPGYGHPQQTPYEQAPYGAAPGYPGYGYPDTAYPGSAYPGSGYPHSGYPGSGYPGGAYGQGWPGVAYVPNNGHGTAALVLGIIGLALFASVVLGVVLGVLAIVFGVLGRAKVARGEATNHHAALTGVILGVAAVVASVVMLFVYVASDDDADSGDDPGYARISSAAVLPRADISR